VSVAEGDPQKVACAHNSLRTSAKASENVGSRLWYHAARRKAPVACLIWRWANKVITENSPNSAGVVLRIAISDHCLCVSNPRCLRTSWKVTSGYRRITNQERIFLGSASRSVRRRAWVSNSACGSWIDTHRARGHGDGHGEQPSGVPHGRLGSDLDRSIVRSVSPYQLAIVVGAQTVLESSATAERLGKRSALRGVASPSARDDAEERARRER
jgi:hypothetical protein